jgi:hypothetical protein
MSRRPIRTSASTLFSERLPRTRLLPMLLLPVLALGLLTSARASITPTRIAVALGGGAATIDPAELTAAAAADLEAATRLGGSGYRFEIVQTSTMVAKPDGPRIPIPAAEGRGTAELADRYYLNAVLETGLVRPDGFWSKMLAGPAEGGKPDWDGARVMFQALVRDGQRWRDDGDGWYQAQSLPGIGLDPETAGLLPTLLRKASAAKDLPTDDPEADPDAARNLTDGAAEADIPGLVAADGLAFTELTDKLRYGFDDAGRLVSIGATARNTNLVDFDLVIETRIRLAYDAVGDLPEPKPALPAEISK